MAIPSNGKSYEKYGWIIVLLVGVYFLTVSLLIALLATGPNDADARAITGMNWNEIVSSNPVLAKLVTYEFQQKEYGTIFWASSVIAIAAYPFRRGERWAWYYLWSVPIILGFLGAYYGSQLGQIAALEFLVLMALIAITGLLLPHRKFFPRRLQ